VAVALTGICVQLFASQLAKFDTVCAVNFLANDVDLLFDGNVEVVKELEVGLPFASCDDRLSKSAGTSTALSPVVANYSSISTSSESFLADKFELSGGIGAVQK
jgi:hypothetical protein